MRGEGAPRETIPYPLPSSSQPRTASCLECPLFHHLGPQSIPIALLFFNVGVEVGQLLFIASVFAIIGLGRQITRRIDVPRLVWAWAVTPYAIGSLAVFWVIQRTAAF